MSKISELSNGGALLPTDDLIVVRSGGNVRAQLSSISGQSVSATTLSASGATTLSSTLAVAGALTASSTLTAQKLVSTNGVLELDDNGSHNGVINVPASLFINIDSDDGATGEDFVIAKDRTGTSGGTELFRVQEDGSVGIGTDTVSRKLEVAGNNNAGAKANYIRITDTDTTATANNQAGGIEFFTNDVTAGIAASMEVLYAGTGGGGEITFNTNASSSGTLTEALRIDESGNVGVGTSSPTSTYRASIKGDYSSIIGGIEFDSGGGDKFTVGHASATSPSATLNVVEAGNMIFKTNNAERMRIDSSGRVLINTTTASELLNVANTAGNGAGVEFAGNGNTMGSTSAFYGQGSGSDAYVWNRANSTVLFGTNNAEAMRIDSSRNLLVGTTTAAPTCTTTIKGALGMVGPSGLSTAKITFNNPSNVKYWGIDTDQSNFYITDADFSHYGYLSQTMTAWAFGSDRRLKENIVDISYGLDAVMAMQPRAFKFKSSGAETIGFIAQELQAVVPEAVTGTEVEYLDDDTPQEKANKSLGVSKDTLIPVLVKAIQEQQATIEALTQRIQTLENN